jgi:hypothetical protein
LFKKLSLLHCGAKASGKTGFASAKLTEWAFAAKCPRLSEFFSKQTSAWEKLV